MKKVSRLLILIVVMANAMALGQATTRKKPNIYVVTFTTRDRLKNDLTSNFTNDFETALVQFGNYTVLERRNMDRVFAEIDREKAFASVSDLSRTVLDTLKAKQADLIIFGEIFDDVASGQINITVTFQAFDGTKVLIKSILLSRGLANDASSRQKTMESLIKDISARTSLIRRTESNGFLFELVDCRKSERTVTCRLSITNNGEDRAIRIYNHYTYLSEKTKMYDDFSAETWSSEVILANKKGDDKFVENLLISGRPAEAIVVFQGVSSKAATITRLDLRCWESEHLTEFPVTFRNIPIEK